MYKLSTLALTISVVSAMFSGVAFAEDDQRDIAQDHLPVLLSSEEIRFSYSSARSAYHCDYVRAETMAILRNLGALDIEVRCSGGLPYSEFNHVTAKFVSLRETTSQKSTRTATLMPVILKFRESCDLHDRIMRSLLEGFDLYEYKKSGSCADSRGRLQYEMKVLK
jgi:hypothetical protein